MILPQTVYDISLNILTNFSKCNNIILSCLFLAYNQAIIWFKHDTKITRQNEVDYMKKFIVAFLSIIMVFSFSTTAFAAEQNQENAFLSAAENVVVPYANSDYNNHWHNQGEATTGSFTVSGSGGSSVKMTLAIDNFAPNTYVEIVIHGGNSTNNRLTSVSSWIGGGLSTSGTREWKFPWYLSYSGYSTYTIQWSIIESTPDSSGRIMCWVY